MTQALQLAEKLLSAMTRAEKAQLLQWMVSSFNKENLMLRYSPFVFALCVPLFLYALPVQAHTQNQSADTKPSSSGPKTGTSTILKTGTQTAQKDVKTSLSRRMFLDVPRGSKACIIGNDLQKSGVLKGLSDNFFLSKRPLTYYEFTVALERVVKSMYVLTLSQDGKTLQSVFAIPHEITPQLADKLLTLWSEFTPELTDLGISSADLNRTTRTLHIYSKMPASTTTFTLDIRNNNDATFQEKGTK